ncbi:MAG: hypothetical protein F4107_13815 [Gemmatimonadetes bacterium]|nr:hypothetical protein [Gemmatimonadota bacterium]MXX33797.1 hypothetical protein [Gemmatimonadota bacterium]MYD14062.1 hypothetical protein [Gemmatimonadota bacterium]MYI66993.1 hypothetical protein [Gemmatimonadota bacterium]
MTSDPKQSGDAGRTTGARQTADPRQAADARFAEALAETGARDPRDYYRDRLRELKRTSPDGYAEGVAYYQNTLVPSIATGEADPLVAWRDYGLLLARLTAPGRAVAVDATGRSLPFEPPGDASDMVLHLPERARDRPVLVSLPPVPTPAQLATHQWLVAGARALAAQTPSME